MEGSTYEKLEQIHSLVATISDYDTSSDEDNIGWQILDKTRECVREGEQKLGFKCKNYTLMFTPSNVRDDVILFTTFILSNGSIIINVMLPSNESVKLIADEITEKLKYLGGSK